MNRTTRRLLPTGGHGVATTFLTDIIATTIVASPRFSHRYPPSCLAFADSPLACGYADLAVLT